MKLFNCIIDDGKDIFKSLVAVKSKKELLRIYGGNGIFEKIEDVTIEYFTEESLKKLNYDLIIAGWGEGERKLLCALLEQHLDDLM